MSWVRLDDAVMSHPKVVVLSDGAFRLWLQVLCFSSRHTTDGRVTAAAVRTLPGANRARLAELARPHTPGAIPLLEQAEDGFIVHDFLAFNPTRATVLAKRAAATARMREWRQLHGELTTETERRDGLSDASVTSLQPRDTRNGDAVCDAPVTPPPSPSPSPIPREEHTITRHPGADSDWQRACGHRPPCGCGARHAELVEIEAMKAAMLEARG